MHSSKVSQYGSSNLVGLERPDGRRRVGGAQGSSLLLGIEGLHVLDVRLDADGRRVARCVTDPGFAGLVPPVR